MSKYKQFPNGVSKDLINENSRKSDCPCCCPNLPPTLCAHFDPVFDDGGGENSNCVSLDTKWGTEDFQMAINFGGSGGCEIWGTDFNQAPASAQQCYSGGGPPVTFGIGVSLFCYAGNQFRATLCMDTTGGYPEWPDTPDDCEQRLELLEPVDSNTCEAMPGEFYVDFGNVTPLGDNSSRTSTGKNISGTASACTCQFHLWIDECNMALVDEYPVYFFPAEGSGGIPGLHSALWSWETIPNIRTPLYQKRPPRRESVPAITGKRVGVGTRVARRLSKAGFRKDEKCACASLEKSLNRHTPEMIRDNLGYWAPQLQRSAEKYFRVEESAARGLVARAMRPFTLRGAEHLLSKACDDELRGLP